MNDMKQIFESFRVSLNEEIGAEKFPLGQGYATYISEDIKRITDLKELAQETYKNLYSNRRRQDPEFGNSSKYKNYNFKEYAVLNKPAIENFVKQTIKNPTMTVTIPDGNSWVQYNIYDSKYKEEIINKRKSGKFDNYSFYYSIGYKKDTKDAINEDLAADWLEFIKKLAASLSNRTLYHNYSMFKHSNNIGNFFNDQDNLKIYFLWPSNNKLNEKLFEDKMRTKVTQFLNETKYFSIRPRSSAGLAREDFTVSYGMYVSAYTAEKMIENISSIKPPTPEKVIQLYNSIIQRIDTTEIKKIFKNKYNINMDEVS